MKRKRRRSSGGLGGLLNNKMLIAGAIGFYLWSQRSLSDAEIAAIRDRGLTTDTGTTGAPTGGAASSTSERIREMTADVPPWGDYF